MDMDVHGLEDVCFEFTGKHSVDFGCLCVKFMYLVIEDPDVTMTVAMQSWVCSVFSQSA